MVVGPLQPYFCADGSVSLVGEQLLVGEDRLLEELRASSKCLSEKHNAAV